MYSFTVTPVLKPSTPIAYLVQIRREDGMCCAKAWTGSYQEAAEWAMHVIESYDLNEHELKEDMARAVAETRVTTGNINVVVDPDEDAMLRARIGMSTKGDYA